MRLPVQKTLKLYVGGKFIRSESGRTLPTTGVKGVPMNVAKASRKDLRDTIAVARGAQRGWAGRTAYNRGQILYRLAEMLEDRADTLPTTVADAHDAIDRAVHHAGWSDKITALMSSLNPVSMAYVNYSMITPLGVVLSAPRAEDGLTGMIEALCVATLLGNAVILAIPTKRAELAAALSEALAVSDVPAGVVNVLMGDVDEIVRHGSRHDDLDGLWLGTGAVSDETLHDAQIELARVMRRVVLAGDATAPASPTQLVGLSEVKTVWMSSGHWQERAGSY